MRQILSTKLFIGSIDDLIGLPEAEWAFVHATQTIHYKIMGWNRTTNKPNKDNPKYIIYENSNHLSLNWVDGAAYLYNWSGPVTFTKVLNFIDKWLPSKNVLVHCDQGYSRSPSICLLYLAKRMKIILNDSYQNAYRDFISIFPEYSPSGIGDYIKSNWDKIE